MSEHLADKRLDVTKYVLDVGVYTRRIKARILYNHMAFSDLPQEYLDAVASSDLLTKIVDHKNYNPRVIEWMTDPHRTDGIMPEKYAEAFVAALDNPSELWSIAFKNHIDASRRNLLFSLFFESRVRHSNIFAEKFVQFFAPSVSGEVWQSAMPDRLR